MNAPKDFAIGQRVQAHPATDRWKQGDRYGTVTRIGRKMVAVHWDRSNVVRSFHPDNLMDAS